MKKQVRPDQDADKQIEIGCAVPLHQKTLAVGTLKSILKQAGVSVEDFIDSL
jgi:poly-beta-hydroxyalkanoate depolymerase